MKKLFNPRLLLLYILVGGFLLRFISLSSVPGGFHANEAAFGYNAYSLLETGRDEYGKFLPIVLESFGDYKGAIYAYLDVPFVKIFGLNPFAVRLPSVIISTLSILLLFIFIKEFTRNKQIALLASFLLAVSPWDITIARVTGDVVLAVFFSLLMSIFLVKLQKDNSIRWLVFSVISGLFAILTYAPFRFYVVALAIVFFLFSVQRIKSKLKFNNKLLIVIVSFIILGILYSFIASVARFNQVSIFSNPQTKLIMEEQIREDQTTPIFVTRAFHNKIINYGRTIIFNAQQYFTLDFLALNGGYPERERIPGVGLFYLWEIPFLLIGIYSIIRLRNKRGLFFITWWILLLSPAFLTFDEIPNIHRTLIVLPAMSVIIAFGIYEIISKKIFSRYKIYKLLLFIISIIILYEFMYFIHQYFVHQNVHQPWHRGYAYQELSEFINNNSSEYDKFVITKGNHSPYIYLLFFTKYDPVAYVGEGSPRDLGHETGFSNFLFSDYECPLNAGKNGANEITGNLNYLYVNKGNCVDPISGAEVIKIINWQDGSPAFRLIRYTGLNTKL